VEHRPIPKLALLGLLVLAAGSLGSAAAAPASKARGARMIKNPRTGRPIVTPGTRKMTADEIRDLVRRHGIRDVEKAVSIALRESGGGWVDAVVDTRGMTDTELHLYWPPSFAKKKLYPELSVGLWQVNLLANARLVGLDPGALTDPEADASAGIALLSDPETNAECLAKLSNRGTSWGPWGG
jgi:hypothetical protein